MGVSLGIGEWVPVGAVVGGEAFVASAGCAAMVGVAEGAVKDAVSGLRQLLTSSPSKASAVRVCLTLLGISHSPCWMGLC
jgi:hypothetical protein